MKAAGTAAHSMTRSILESNYDGFAGDEECQKMGWWFRL